MGTVLSQLSLYGKLAYLTHLFKALTKHHHQEYLPILNECLKSDSIIIDVGAHAGQFTKLFSALVPEGHVYAFEPGGYASSILKKVIRLYRLKNVTHINKGLGKQYKKENLIIPLKQSGSLGFGLSHIGNDKQDVRATISETIEIIMLDTFAKDENLERVDFIKADIEGWEMQLLLGAKLIIHKWHPILTLEVNRHFMERAENTPEELWSFLSDNNYEVNRLYYDENKILQIELAAEPFDGNIICYPR
jgi:FkbM family methyltransferase